MGKDLKGRELGVGISQRKDGLYTARFTNRLGKRKQQYFKKLQECRQWLADAQFEDSHGNVLSGEAPTVDAWFNYWLDEIKGNSIRYNTRKYYNDRYRKNIKPLIGNMLLKDVKPMHCQNALNQMMDRYMESVIKKSRSVMWMFFDSAVENELITKNPITKSVKCIGGREVKKRRSLTIEEQKLFLETIKNSNYYNPCALILQTGLRAGELIGLHWSDIDFENSVLHICRTMEYCHSAGEWKVGKPKTKGSARDIPLTREAVSILRNQKERLKSLKIIPIEFSDLVFLGINGKPTNNSVYNSSLRHYCSKAGIKRFSMHTLRHTFATRCIEGGMRPKTLQVILGHSSIGMTMNLYVHVTNNEKVKEIQNIENMLIV